MASPWGSGAKVSLNQGIMPIPASAPAQLVRGSASLYVRRAFSDPTIPLLRFLPEATKINFVGARYVAFAIDGLLLLASIVSIAIHDNNLGIDFTGGVLMEVKSAQVIGIGKMRSDVGSLGFKET